MIRPCGYLENVWPLSSSLLRKERREAVKKEGGRMVIRDGLYQHPDIGKTGTWSPMRSAVQRANKIILTALPQLEIASVVLEEVGPETAMVWERGGSEITVIAVVVTNPRCRLYAGQMSAHIPVGDIVSVDPQNWWSVVNDGPVAHLHLVLTLASRENDPG